MTTKRVPRVVSRFFNPDDDLVARLRGLSLGTHDDLSIGEEAAARIEELTLERDEAREDMERLQFLIYEAYSGPPPYLGEPDEIGLVIGEQIKWPEGVRAAIDAARGAGKEKL